MVETFSTPGGLILDPVQRFGVFPARGQKLGRSYLGIELDPKYHAAANQTLAPQAARAGS
jgi:adenine-specific DNA-methyltransferase